MKLKTYLTCILALLIPAFALAASETDQELLKRKMDHVAWEWQQAAQFPRTPAVAPSNDLCSGAEVIPSAGPFPYLTAVTADITDATSTGDPAVPACPLTADVSRSIWYKFVPAATSTYTISACASATATTVDDTYMVIYTSSDDTCGGTFTDVACNDDDNCGTEPFQSSITTTLTSGTTYYIGVFKFGQSPPTAGNTAVQLKVTQPPTAPANDSCSGTVPALSLNTPVSGVINSAATDDYELSGSACFTGVGQTASTAAGRDLVYSFTPPTTGNYSFKVNSLGSSDPVLYVADNCATGTPPLVVGGCQGAANRNSLSGDTVPASEEVMCIPLTGSTPYYVYVDEDAATAGTSFTLQATQCITESESNDTPATANALSCGIEGSIAPLSSDTDFFDLGTPADGARLFAMAETLGANTTDFDMRVTTATDTLQYDDASNDLAFGGNGPNCSGTALSNVQSYINMDSPGSGTISEPYRLYAVVQPDSATATAESEPNDTVGTADFGTNNYFSGTISTNTDTDIFGFVAAPGDELIIQLDTDPGRDNTPFNGALALLDSAGNVLVSVNDFGATSSTTSGAGSLTATTPFSPGEALLYRVTTVGRYYARVTRSGGTTPNDYLLSISKNCGAAGTGGNPVVDLSVTKTDSPDPVVPNHVIQYTITVSNAGPDAADTATLSDDVPAKTVFQSLTTPAGWSCTTPSVGATGTVSCSNGSFAASGSDQFQLSVQVASGLTDGTVITNTATVATATPDFDATNNSATATTTTQCPAIDLTPTTLPSSLPGSSYSQSVAGTGGTEPYSYSFTGTLPDGLSLDSGTGAITGTPTTPGLFSFTVQATDADGCAGSRNYSIRICPVLSITPASLNSGIINHSYSQALSGSGGASPYSFQVTSGALPNGITLSSSGSLSGSPTEFGLFNFDVQVTDNNGCTATQSFSLTIDDCLFCDDFDDGVLATDWTYVKPLWTEPVGTNLIGAPTGRKAIAIATPVFTGCLTCSVEAKMQTAGGLSNRVWLLGWYIDKKNTMELLMNQEGGKWILKQRVNGSVVLKAKGAAPILPNVSYDVVVTFDGTKYTVTVDGNLLITLTPSGGSARSGTVGFQVKNTTGTFDMISVN